MRPHLVGIIRSMVIPLACLVMLVSTACRATVGDEREDRGRKVLVGPPDVLVVFVERTPSRSVRDLNDKLQHDGRIECTRILKPQELKRDLASLLKDEAAVLQGINTENPPWMIQIVIDPSLPDAERNERADVLVREIAEVPGVASVDNVIKSRLPGAASPLQCR